MFDQRVIADVKNNTARRSALLRFGPANIPNWSHYLLDSKVMTRDALLKKINQSYQTMTRLVEFDGLQLDVLRCCDADQVLDEAVRSEEAGEAGWQPYWAEAWDSSIALGSWQLHKNIRAKQTLDLGCGLGIAGCLAAHQGSQVLLGDSAPPSLDFATWNSWPWRDQVEVRLIDWKSDRLDQHAFELILGADILYEKESWSFQSEFCKYHLADAGQLLLAEPNRRLSDGFQQAFEADGWHVEKWMYHPSLTDKAVRMFRCLPQR